jgi:hypothetical protein
VEEIQHHISEQLNTSFFRKKTKSGKRKRSKNHNSHSRSKKREKEMDLQLKKSREILKSISSSPNVVKEAYQKKTLDSQEKKSPMYRIKTLQQEKLDTLIPMTFRQSEVN